MLRVSSCFPMPAYPDVVISKMTHTFYPVAPSDSLSHFTTLSPLPSLPPRPPPPPPPLPSFFREESQETDDGPLSPQTHKEADFSVLKAKCLRPLPSPLVTCFC